VNPFVNLPSLLALNADFTVAQQRTLALKIALFSGIMRTMILLAGQQIIGIAADQLRIAGVLAHIAWSMLNGGGIASRHGNDAEQDHLQSRTSLAFYPARAVDYLFRTSHWSHEAF